MKPASLFLALIALSISAVAEVKMPKSVYTADEFEKAKADAKTKGKPVSILYTLQNSGCPLCDGSSQRAVKELNGKTVMVFFSSGSGTFEKLPPAVQSAMRSPELGRNIPKVAVFDSDVTTPIAYVAYSSDDKVLDKAYREANRKIREAKTTPPAR